MSLAAIHQSTSISSKSKGKQTFSSVDAKQCMSCGKCWPWVVFNLEVVHHTSNVCTRCARPDLEVDRWKEIGKEMHVNFMKAREKLSKHRPNLLKLLNQQPQKEITLNENPNPPINIVKPSSSHLPTDSSVLSSAPPPSPQVQTPILPQIQSAKQPQIQTTIQPQVPQVESQIQRQTSPPKFNLSERDLLKEEQLKLIAGNIPVLKTLQEPQRSIIWLQLAFQPSPNPPNQIPQVEIFKAYKHFFQDIIDSVSSDPNSNVSPLFDGTELVKLTCELWKDKGVILKGRPHYTVIGLKVKEWNSRNDNEGQSSSLVVNGSGNGSGLDGGMEMKSNPPSASGQNQINHNPPTQQPQFVSQIRSIPQSQPQIQPQTNFQQNFQSMFSSPSPFTTPPVSNINDQSRIAPTSTSGNGSFTNRAPLAPSDRIQQREESIGQNMTMAAGNSTINVSNQVKNDSTLDDNSKAPDLGVEEDDWDSLRPSKKSKIDHPIQVLSNDQKITTELSVHPRSIASSTNNSQQSKHKPEEEEEIDELDDDDDLMLPSEMKIGSRDERAKSEDEVGDMLI